MPILWTWDLETCFFLINVWLFLIIMLAFLRCWHWLVPLTGDKFLRWSIVLALAGGDWSTISVYNICLLLFCGSDFCEEKCGGNKRKNTSRNRNSTCSSGVKRYLNRPKFFILRPHKCSYRFHNVIIRLRNVLQTLKLHSLCLNSSLKVYQHGYMMLSLKNVGPNRSSGAHNGRQA